ncbi:MAG: molybdopterin-converting factor chain 2 [Gammaproteobacteria bacterium]|nr:MAG: molybdopterin-converting factor chain 2 [Gammaproteobacteria bacterium]
MFAIVSQTIDVKDYKKQLKHDQCGGFCSFEGWVRNHNGGDTVSRLQYSAYEELAMVTGEAIIRQAKAQFDIESASCVHRIGSLSIGDTAIWVGVSAAHREAAFQACRYIIDMVKADVPIWKKEFYLDKQSHEWVANTESRT